MANLQINESLLVNRGLGAALATDSRAMDFQDTGPVAADVVESFKSLVTRDVALDINLVSVISAFTSPLELATYFINAKYAELGGAAGVLGTTSSAVTPTANGLGFARTFNKGTICWHQALGAHELHGAILTRWRELGAESGFLGFPSSDVSPGADLNSEGLFAHFQGGSIYWAPAAPQPFGLATSVGSLATMVMASTASAAGTSSTAAAAAATATPASTRALGSASRPALSGLAVRPESTIVAAVAATPAVESSAGAFEVHGAIRQKYLALGAEASFLGYPRSDESGTPDGIGRYNHFHGGSIYWTPATTAHEVHGLIRDRWASEGWERNPQLGYPISDELIPDPRIGHRRPETRKKPIAALPLDVIKLPAEAVTAVFPESVVNTAVASAQPAVLAANAPQLRTTLAAVTPASGALGKLSDKVATATAPIATAIVAQPSGASTTLDRDRAVPGALLTAAASTPAERSINRFGDFENGVLFWFRGATSATTLSPLGATSDGTSLSFSGADITNALVARLGRPSFEGTNMTLASMTFVGTTGYSFDGAQVHNRRHKVQLILMGTETQPLNAFLGLSVETPVTATIELQIEVWLEASQRQLSLALVDWSLLHASSGTYAQSVTAYLRSRLDPALWIRHELTTLPDTDAGKPIAVLSVKTLPSGAVAVYVEPTQRRLGTVSDTLDTGVRPTVIFSNSNN